jgi:hypothetical protein
MTKMPGIGRRQRRVLQDMVWWGRGRWPAYWRFYSTHQEVMKTLFARGLVTRADRLAEVTPEGRKLVDPA